MWIFLALASAFFSGLYNFFAKISMDSIHPIIVFMFLTWISLFIGFVYMFFLIKTKKLEVKWYDIKYNYLIWAWLFSSIGEILYFYMFKENIGLSIGSALVIWWTMIVAAFLCMFFLKEKLSIYQMFGIIFALFGVFLLSLN